MQIAGAGRACIIGARHGQTQAARILRLGRHPGSLTAAAKAEGVAPAIMGRRLDALEERLGVKLLVRTTRRITLTHEGSAFLEDCQRLLVDLANAEASVSAGGVKASGHLRITAPAGFGRRHVAPLVPRFRELHPDVTISLNLSDRVVDVAGEGFDCAVRVGDLPDSSLVSVRLADNRRLLRGHARLPASRHGTPQHPDELARFACLTLSSDASQTRGWAFRVPSTSGDRGDPPQAGRPARLLRRPGAARLVPGRPRHRLAQHLGGGEPRSPPAGWCRCSTTSRRRPTASTRCSRSASTCRCGCGCGSTSSSTTTRGPSSGAAQSLRQSTRRKPR